MDNSGWLPHTKKVTGRNLPHTHTSLAENDKPVLSCHTLANTKALRYRSVHRVRFSSVMRLLFQMKMEKMQIHHFLHQARSTGLLNSTLSQTSDLKKSLTSYSFYMIYSKSFLLFASYIKEFYIHTFIQALGVK